MAEDLYSAVRAACVAQPEYLGGTAYTRTKIFCEHLMNAGLGIPGWMTIREIIGKGSSSDISRGVKDFRAEHAERLRRRSVDADLPGMPPQLADGFAKVWDLAMQYARAELADREQRLTAAMDEAALKVAQAETRVAEARSSADLDKARADGLNAALSQASLENARILESLENKNKEIAALKSAHTSEKNALQKELLEAQKQRDELRSSVAEIQRHALMQIESARQEFRTQINAATKAIQAKDAQLLQAKKTEYELLSRISQLASECDQLKGRITQISEAQSKSERTERLRRAKRPALAEKHPRDRKSWSVNHFGLEK